MRSLTTSLLSSLPSSVYSFLTPPPPPLPLSPPNIISCRQVLLSPRFLWPLRDAATDSQTLCRLFLFPTEANRIETMRRRCPWFHYCLHMIASQPHYPHRVLCMSAVSAAAVAGAAALIAGPWHTPASKDTLEVERERSLPGDISLEILTTLEDFWGLVVGE